MFGTKAVLQTPRGFIKDLVKSIDRAQTRVYITCFILNEDESTAPAIAALIAAAQRSVDVRVAADFLTFDVIRGHRLPLHYRAGSVVSATTMRQKLRSAGVKFQWLGQMHGTFLTGRTHSKWYVVDDVVYTFGGINLDRNSLDFNDFMFRLDNKPLADALAREQINLMRADSRRAMHRSYDVSFGESTLLVDGGRFANSIIYKRVCQLAAAADEIIYVSQYCPTSKLSRILKRKSATIYYNQPSHTPRFFDRVIIRVGAALSRQATSYQRDQYLHAKFMIFRLPNGTQKAIVGSYNFLPASALLGTHEVAFETDDTAIIKQLNKFYRTKIA
jgi:cardiolipin synthase